MKAISTALGRAWLAAALLANPLPSVTHGSDGAPAPPSTRASEAGTPEERETPPEVDECLTDLEIVPGRIDLRPGGKIEFLAVGSFAGGWVEDLTQVVSWTSDDETVVTVGPTGVAAAVGAGEATVRISYRGHLAEAVVLVTKEA